MSIKYIKLLNGETIICKVNSDTSYCYEVLVPMMTSIQTDSEGTVVIAFMKWLPFSPMEEPVILLKSSVIAVANVNENVQVHYENVLLTLHKSKEDTSEDMEQMPDVTDEEKAFDDILSKKGMTITSKLKN